MRSERARTASMSCSISTIVTERRSVRIRSATRSRSWAARPASGSSSSRSSGRVASAIAISSSRWSPWDRVSAISKARSPSPTARRNSSASAFRSAKLPASASIAKRQRCLAWAAMRTFSKTVSAWKMLMIWNERETPAATIACGRRPVIAVERNRAWPRSAGRRPVRKLKRVVLPAPFGPMIERKKDHAKKEEPFLGPRRERVAHEDEHRRTHGGPDEAPHPAHERHRGDLAGQRDVERFRVGEVQQERVEGAGEPAEGARHDERGELVTLDVVADEARARLVLADRLEHPPEG